MASQVTGRKRIPNREKLSAEDDALIQIAREAEARLAAKRAARAEAREIRMKELERQQKEISDDEERMSVGSRGSLRGNHADLCSSTSSLTSARLQNGRVEERSDFLEKGSRTASTLSAATLASLGGGLSRRGSCDTSISADTEASIREMKVILVYMNGTRVCC
nr:leucine-rich repeat flightless-interacting protein 1 isoform X27 [Danio rerio]XP_021329750.1 leucine-rich repeat flightless-interacting protein 1 isoform X39 [Danio rerio]|eukprot:XP_021327411.1 leucine-rich repeat flightless-interacting protein 1 isoform X27 [Danio rerio]